MQEEHSLAGCKDVVQQAAGRAVELLELRVTTLGNQILQTVMRQPYSMKLHYDIRWDRGEAEILFLRDGMEFSPLDDSGFGAVDMAVFCLRISLWALRDPQPCPILVFDEPFKHLAKQHHPVISKFVQHLAQVHGMQFIACTHEEGLSESADKVFRVTNENKRSTVSAEQTGAPPTPVQTKLVRRK